MSDFDAYYGAGLELERLSTREGRLELARTQELLLRHLPARGRVLDVGGGAGIYAAWLAGLGYDVALLDPVALHVEEARNRGVDAQRGDARTLPFAAASFDAVLLLGPLYHLPDPRDRARALAEVRRVAVGNGVVAAAAISRFAPLLGSVLRGTSVVPDAWRNALQESATGRRVPRERRVGPFPDAWFHLPGSWSRSSRARACSTSGCTASRGRGGWPPTSTSGGPTRRRGRGCSKRRGSSRASPTRARSARTCSPSQASPARAGSARALSCRPPRSSRC